MNGLFSLDNPVMKFLTKVCDVFILSLLWLVCSIPIVTIGASTTALYYSSVKSIRRDRGYVSKEFFKSFKMNFLQGLIITFVFGILSLLFVTNIQFAQHINGDFGTVLHIVYIVMCLVVWGTAVYCMPVLSRFTMTTFGLVKTSFFLFFKHFPQSILITVIIGLCLFGTYYLPILVVAIPAGGALLVSLIMEPILKKYTPQDEDGEGKRDQWYLE